MTVGKNIDPIVQSARSGHTRRHVLIDAWGSPAERLDDADGIRALLERVIDTLGATLLDLSLRQFSPQGVTAVAMLAESHLAVHTWPEQNYFAADLFYCGAGDSAQAVQMLADGMGAVTVRRQDVTRGFDQMPARVASGGVR
ncbi:MAG: adenosylmethionine decarboxylase [Ilumatobacter sp.]|jgi:S-adenosylmethionine decarboxylase|nr:adenosylmethionine decarboxylase [Ilumatobacter sp.]